jgi:hypothetical protein
MILILQVILTFWVCNNLKKTGKRWALGLIPMGVAVVFGLFVGIILGAMGVNVSVETLAPLVILDIGAIIALIWMGIVNKPPKS